MTDLMTRQIVLASRPEGPVQPENFRLEEIPVPSCPPGGLLLRTLFLSLDSDMRGRTVLDAVSIGVAGGGIEYREDVTEGLKNAPSPFVGMLAGRNFGKTLVRLADGPPRPVAAGRVGL
ncbi:hypothetical protein [Lichenihabitans sp. PAMC28606]|uniref:hypothetical protein n=1 Tax=Lichenihabitans sp. PAMC28606 TaxID=2880932 RepID=UPI0029CAC2AB|nr:hypothetical protein [Lichenihabitans sp. PAMC28606]